ncbi:response regulator [Candidatus Pantoea soli]|uniref:Response regulator n=1 Tax=Candidatus Pantoea soli TaxID=3098669 RepID=A0A518XIZ2_9GAMM|nr:response regulator [Pantoea soli]QDY44076.1 response regulator [Pantoea soli]
MSAKIWLIDEDLSLREALSFLLKAMEYEVADFAAPAAFDRAAAQQHAVHGCLLLDAGRQTKGGLAWLAEQEARFPLLPVIIMTDDASVEACRHAAGDSAFGVFAKPLDIEPLLDTIRLAMQESEQRMAAVR